MAELILVPPVYQKTVYMPPSSSYKLETYPVMFNEQSGLQNPNVRAYVNVPQPMVTFMPVNPLDDMLNFYTMSKDVSNIINHNLSHDEVSRRFWGKEDIHEMVRRWFYDDLLIQINSSDDTYNYNNGNSSKIWRFCFTDKRDFETFKNDFSKIKNHRFIAKKSAMFDLVNWLKSNTSVFDVISSYNSSEIFIKDHVDAVNFKLTFVNGEGDVYE